MPPDAHQRRRARQACTHCNARRVKCNVTERVPCDNCATAGTDCELRTSRRGKHPRHRPSQAINKQAQSQSPPRSQKESRILPPPVPQQYLPTTVTPDTSTYASTDASPPNENDPPSLVSRSEYTSPNDEELSQASQALASLYHAPRHGSNPGAKPEDGSEYGASLFFGESSSIRYIGTDNLASSMAKLDSALAQMSSARNQRMGTDAIMANLKTKPDGPLALPPRHITTALLKAYFQWFHPFCPLVDEKDIWHQFETGSLSTLLLQSLLFVATSHCDDSVLIDGQLGHRVDAKATFYNRARDLYDADIEPQTIILMQSLILMSFWRGTVADEKDSRHWIGVAISMAQRRGLHRSRNQGKHGPYARVPDRQRKLARRVWWSIYMHERQTSASLGLPQRIRDDDCDVEPLEAGDFEFAFGPTRAQSEIEDSIDYTICITELSKLHGSVLELIYKPNKHSTLAQRAQLRDELVQWKQNLPPAMRIDDDVGLQPGLHTSMLHMAYNNIFVLLYRNCFTDSAFDKEGQVAVQAAARTARIIEDMLPRGILRHAQIHVITNISNTLFLNTVELRFASGMARASAEHRCKVCLLGMREMQNTWQFSSWVRQLFTRHRDAPGGQRQQQQQQQQQQQGGIESEATMIAMKSETPLQASYGTAMSRVNSNLLANMGDFDGFSFNFGADMGPMEWPVEEMERFLFSQIYDSNPFW